MSLNLVKIYDICRDNDTLLENLQNWGLIPREKSCPKCGYGMSLMNVKEDGWTWYCSNKISIRKQRATKCSQKVSMRKGSFFNRSHMSYFQILGFAHLWSEGLQLRQIKCQLEIGSTATLVDWSSFCREVGLVLRVRVRVRV